MSDVIRISAEHKELLEDMADQLDTSIKAVVDGILDWFFNDAFDIDEDEVEEEEEEED